MEQKIDLDALEAALAKSTPGEWAAEYGYVGDKRQKFLKRNKERDRDRLRDLGYDDADFIALAHNALPALLAELRELRARTTPEPIGDKHKDGNWWLMWEPGYEQWLKLRWRYEVWQYGGGMLLGTPTHALPMPPAPGEPNAKN